MSNRNYERKNSNQGAYVYGNTVRKLATEMPASRPQRQDRIDEQKETRESIQRRRDNQRAHKMNFLYTVAVVGVLAFMFTLCVQYLKLQAAVKSNASTVAAMESQLSELSADNDMTEVEINGNIDYDNLLNIALNELGMVYPSRNQVVEYKSTESEYVKQFSEIPAVK